MIEIDGSMGEGGGQVLRTSLALSMVTGEPFRIENIRAGRRKAGLLRQHLTCVHAARQVSGGAVNGAALGSSGIEFTPGTIRGGDYSFAIGTAGSTTLVLQTILPALATAPEPSRVTISGGTHNPHAPSVDFLRRSFLPLLGRMGPSIDLELNRHGFFPAGGGEITVQIQPCETLRPIELVQAEPISSRRAVATIAGLPGLIARRELDVVGADLGWPESCLKIEQLSEKVGPGNILSIEVGRGDVTEVFTGFGERGVSSEKVGSRAAKDASRYINSHVPVWRFLADQLMLPLALAGGGRFRTCPLSLHAKTNAEVIELFLPIKIQRSNAPDESILVEFTS